ncbi:hypothetical protein B0H14DRAFT_2559105 [Mycena olivaceomarginata]|nr:hypothetical protein B0H14DRAFT_2559105 [Mycena olivaceomarginata]
MARSGSDTLRYWAGESGLPRVGLGGLRREAGNMYALQLGTRLVKDIMNHASDEGPHRDSYSRNMGNLPLKNDERHAFMGPAIECPIRRAQEEEVDVELAKQEKKDAKDALLEHPKLKPLHKVQEAAWSKYLDCFNAIARGYDVTQAKKIEKLRSAEEYL